MSLGESVKDDPGVGNESSASTRSWKLVFASPFTPSWFLGMVLAACLFLPAFRGCNDEVIYLADVIDNEEVTLGLLYLGYLLVWPLLFGLAVFVGTLVLAWSSNPQRANILWCSFAVLIAINSTLFAVVCLPAFTESGMRFDTWYDWLEAAMIACWSMSALGLPAALVATYRRCGNWFTAAMWMQLVLAFVAAACTSVVAPAFVFARELLIGGKLMIVASTGLIVSTIIQLLDGQRVLLRGPRESPLRLSLKAMFLLMAVGGLATAWVGTFLLVTKG